LSPDGTGAEVSVVVVTWDGLALLRACLDSVAAQQGVRAEIVVVDNGSRDGTAAWLARAHPGARIVALPRNLGFARGCNAGIRAATAPWVLTLNNDATLEPGALRLLLDAAQAAPADVGMLQPQVRFPDGARLQSTGIEVLRNGCAHDRSFGVPIAQGPAAGEVLCPTAGAALYRRDMLERLSGGADPFDATFHMYCEDVDLGWRARLAGWSARYLADAVVTHVWQGSSKRLGPNFVVAHCKRNRLRTLLKNGSAAFLLATWRRTLEDLAWLLRHEGGRGLSGWVGALCDGAAGRRTMRRLVRVDRRDLERRWMR